MTLESFELNAISSSLGYKIIFHKENNSYTNRNEKIIYISDVLITDDNKLSHEGVIYKKARNFVLYHEIGHHEEEWNKWRNKHENKLFGGFVAMNVINAFGFIIKPKLPIFAGVPIILIGGVVVLNWILELKADKYALKFTNKQDAINLISIFRNPLGCMTHPPIWIRINHMKFYCK